MAQTMNSQSAAPTLNNSVPSSEVPSQQQSAKDNSSLSSFFSSWRVSIISFIFLLLDLIDVRHRVNAKPAWALLIKKARGRITKGDLLMASLPRTRYAPPSDYEEWVEKMKELMRGSDVDVDLLINGPPTRGLNFPTSTFGIEKHQELYEYFDVKIRQRAQDIRALEKAISHGGKEGVDQAWLATPNRIATSLARYTVDRPPSNSHIKAKIVEAADSLFADFPEMYDAPRPMTVSAVINASTWKYSAGLPFLPVVKKRADLKSSMWIHAIRRAAERILASGEFPGMAFHAFPKNQILALENFERGKPLRTVTAEDRITAIAYNCLAMERNKRLPPARALVLPSERRTEGGLAGLYSELLKREHIFSGDATAFDSTASTDLVVEGPVRLWQNAMVDRYGEVNSTSFIRAYYSALADGHIVSLLDGRVTRKTGGGGTGSAPTSVDNRDWVRIAFRAAWSVATELPCSEFSKHVTFANASDDIEIGVGDLTLNLLPKIVMIMEVEMGVRFTLNKEDGPDNMLHLKLIELNAGEGSQYHKLEITPANDFSVIHDPARLWTMRSEYRADRMKANWLVSADVIATRSQGHAYLTAHQLGSYADIAEDWIDSVSDFMLAHFRSISIVRERNDDGDVVAVSCVVNDEGEPTQLRKLAQKFYPSSQDSFITSKQRMARRWLVAHSFPSYDRVFRLWTEKPKERGAAITKRYAKLDLPPVLSLSLDIGRIFAVHVSDALHAIPTSLVKMAGEPDVYRLSRVYTSAEFLVERYAYYRLSDTLRTRTPSDAELAVSLRTSMFGSCVDVYGFALARGSSTFLEKMNFASEADKDHAAAQLIATFLIYSVSDMLIIWLMGLRVIGVIVVLMFAATRDMDRLYSVLSLGAWVARGQNSIEISNLSFRDPFLFVKVFSLSLAQSLPLQKVPCKGLYKALGYLDYPVRFLTQAQRFKMVSASLEVEALAGKDAPFCDAVDYITARGLRRREIVVMSGGTGLGKSTVLVASILERPQVSRVVLLVPTNLLLNTYRNNWVNEALICRYSAADARDHKPFPEFGVIVMTHALASRLLLDSRTGVPLMDESHKPETHLATRSTCILIDEVGTRSFDVLVLLVIAEYLSQFAIFAAMSATPDFPYLRDFRVKHISLPDRKRLFMVTSHPVDTQDLVTVPAMWDIVKQVRPDYGRLLWIEPLLEEARKTVLSLQMVQISCSLVSSELPVISETGSIVATSIIDTGITVEPPPDVLVDMGTSLAIVPSHVSIQDLRGTWVRPRTGRSAMNNLFSPVLVASSPSTHTQRLGRVGRLSNADAIFPTYAGTGPMLPVPVSIFRLLEGGYVLTALKEKCNFPPIPLETDGAIPYLRWVHVHPQRRKQWPLYLPNVAMVKVAFICAIELGGWSIARNVLLHPEGRRDERVRFWTELIDDVLVGDIPSWVLDCAEACCGFRYTDRAPVPLPNMAYLYGEPPELIVVR